MISVSSGKAGKGENELTTMGAHEGDSGRRWLAIIENSNCEKTLFYVYMFSGGKVFITYTLVPYLSGTITLDILFLVVTPCPHHSTDVG